MTHTPPPPDDPSTSYEPGFTPQMPAIPRWSAAAISGFVLSLIGCIGIAPLGLILGIVGIVRTRGGERRGRGLAIAAIPISLVTGVLAFCVGSLFWAGVRVTQVVVTELPAIFSSNDVDSATAVANLRELCSDAFNEDVSAERLKTWVAQIAAKHGRLIDIQVDPTAQSTPGQPVINFKAKCVNGSVNLKITVSTKEWTRLKLTVGDIEIDGASPRRP